MEKIQFMKKYLAFYLNRFLAVLMIHMIFTKLEHNYDDYQNDSKVESNNI